MIKGNKKEREYRSVNLDSSSSLKEFSLDKRKYYKKYILGEKVEDTDNKAMLMGRVVEVLLLEPELFDEKFFMSTCESAPTGMMLAFVEALYKHTLLSTDDNGVVSRKFEEIANEAYLESGFKISFDAVLKKFIGTENEEYYKEIREVRKKGLSVVTVEDVTNAEKIVTELKTNFATNEVVNLMNDVRWEVFNQFPIEGYDVDGVKFKSLIDKVVVDHTSQTIQIYDLKCVWAVENFYEEYYLYRRAYIQAFLYHKSILNSENIFGFDHSDYEVLCPAFIVCDSINYNNPLIFKLSVDDLDEAYEGFSWKNREYPGVKELIENLKWHKEIGIWNISRKNYLSGGLVKLK